MTTAVAPAPSKSAAQRKRSSARGPSMGTRRGNVIAGIAAWAIGNLPRDEALLAAGFEDCLALPHPLGWPQAHNRAQEQ